MNSVFKVAYSNLTKTFIYCTLHNAVMSQAEWVINSAGPATVKFKGEFLFDDVYRGIVKWFKKHRLSPKENLYKDKPGAFEGRIITIKLYGDAKVTEYYKHVVNVKIEADNYVEQIVNVNGKKVKVGRGKIKVNINGKVIADYKGLFEVKSNRKWVEGFYKVLGKVMFVLRKNEMAIREMADLSIKLGELSNEIKHFLNMESKV